MNRFWYYAEGGDTRGRGPITFDELIANLSSLPSAKGILVWREGFDDWKTAESVREIVDRLFRPPPLTQGSLVAAHIEGKLSAVPTITAPDITVHRKELETVARNQQNTDTRGRTAFLLVLVTVVLVGAYFTNQVYGNSSYGIAYLVGGLATPWIILTAITWKFRHSTYTAAAVLAVAALITASANIGKLQESLDVQESKAALQGAADYTKIDDALRQHPSNKFLQLMAMANRTATETNAAVEKLLDEIEPAALSKDIELVTANRTEIEALRRDLKTAEANTATFMSSYVSLLKAEREKVENFGLSIHFDEDALASFLKGVDKRHATGTAFFSKVILARFDFYRAYGNYVAVLLENYGAYNVVNGKFTFPLQTTADRFNAAASAMEAAAKRQNELEDERKQLAQLQQDKWDEFVKSK
jgi:hypothetical protein